MARKNKVAKKRQPKGPKEPEGGNETKPLAVNSGETSHAAFFEQLGPSGHLHGKDSLSKDVNIERYSMSTPDGLTPLLVDTPLKISAKRRYGLVGRNGYGKTTLLQNMANYRIENFPRHVRMLLVNQEVSLFYCILSLIYVSCSCFSHDAIPSMWLIIMNLKYHQG